MKIKITTKKLLSLLDKKEKQIIGLLFLAVLVMGLAEMACIVSIIPFLAVVSYPNLIETNSYLHLLYSTFSLTMPHQVIFILALGVFILLVTSNVLAVLTTWAILSFSFKQGHVLATRLLTRYLQAPYDFYLNRNACALSQHILSDVNKLVLGVLMGGLLASAKLVVIFCIFVLLLMIDSKLALTVGGVLGGAYLLVYYFVYKRLSQAGTSALLAQSKKTQCVLEAFGGIKEIKFLSCESYFIDRFKMFSKQYAKAQSLSQITVQVTRYFIELVAFGGLLLMVLYLLGVQQKITDILPVIGLYALAGYRLMPLIQQVFNGVSQLRYDLASLDIIYQEFSIKQNEQSERQNNKSQFVRVEKIFVHKLSFQYPNSSIFALSDISFEIDIRQPNLMIAFVGSTGSGKTTFVDLLLGLLTPTEGIIKINDIVLSNDNILQWQANIGYASQNIFLIDDCVKNNIAFGIDPQKIDLDRVHYCARLAHLHEFIINDLPNGYDTMVGQNGIRFSGGQKQRIGIARALYRDPQILIFDEATSALDDATEKSIFESIRRFMPDKTIIIVAHRLTTIECCDMIYVFAKGNVKLRRAGIECHISEK